jgi:hypothetical protein
MDAIIISSLRSSFPSQKAQSPSKRRSIGSFSIDIEMFSSAQMFDKSTDFDLFFEDTEQLLEVKKTKLPKDFVPGNYHVRCGRGKDCFNAFGNRRFRVIIEMFQERYKTAESKSAKSNIVSNIIDMIRSAGGGFVKYEDGQWWEVGDNAAREKVGATFRDILHDKYRSSSKAKSARRKI